MFSVDTVTRFPESSGNEVLGPGSYNPGEYGGLATATIGFWPRPARLFWE